MREAFVDVEAHELIVRAWQVLEWSQHNPSQWVRRELRCELNVSLDRDPCPSLAGVTSEDCPLVLLLELLALSSRLLHWGGRVRTKRELGNAIDWWFKLGTVPTGLEEL